MNVSERHAHIQHISCLGLPGEVALPAMLQTLDTLVSAQNSNFAWTDRRGRLTNYYARHVDPASLDIMLHHSHLLNGPGELSFEMHSCSTLVTGNLGRFRAMGNLDRTITYNEIWKPNAIEQFLDLVVHDESGPRALLTLGRTAEEKPFSPADTRCILAVRPWILHAMDTPPRGEVSSIETGEEAILVCDHFGRVLQMGPNARKLLLYAGNGRIGPGAVVAGLGDAMPETVRRVCQDMARILSGRPGQVPQARLATPFGAFRFRAHSLGDSPGQPGAEGLLAVVIRREAPLSLVLVNRVADLPLTPRQRQVAVQIGLSKLPETIQIELDLSPGTYRRHVEDIHVRLDVRSRSELMAALMSKSDTGTTVRAV